jgi:hypothetical protein
MLKLQSRVSSILTVGHTDPALGRLAGAVQLYVRVKARTIVSISMLNFNCDRGSSHPSNLSQNYVVSCMVTAL